MTRKPGEPLFMRGLDAWIMRELDHPDDLPLDEIPEPSEEQMLLDMLWDRVNALGGGDDVRVYRGVKAAYRTGRATGFNEAVDATLAILEEAGARPSNQRLEPSR